MTLRERDHDGREGPLRAVAPPNPIDLRANGERLLTQGADAIDRALSQNSAAFLAANRQEGGQ